LATVELSALDDWIACDATCDRAGRFRALTADLRRLLREGNVAAAEAALRRAVLPTLDYTSAQSLCRICAQIRERKATTATKTRLAVLGSFTTKQLVSLIDLYLFAAGINAELYEADYGVFRQEILDPGSALYEFQPQIVFLATSWRDLVIRPKMSDGREQVARMVESEQADWHRLWETLQSRCGCQVIQNNFVMPAVRALGNHESRHPASLSRYLLATNQHLLDTAPPFVTIHDVDHLASVWGRWNWDDPRFVHHAKMPCSPECLVDYAHSIASLVSAHLGLAKKCLVLDLDNTLWGGVIGDDGLGGIRLGQGDALGEAFLAFQHYAQDLQLRGVLLAVCSKNDEAIAREVFEKHPEMVLRLSDFSCFAANWNDKATNLRSIAATLNLGLGSLVFVDDNPAERAIVRRLVPEVAVPELPEDVAEIPRVLERYRYFQVISLGTEDLKRTEYYRADALRKSAQSSSGDMAAYLRSLDMAAKIRPIDEVTLERSVQLVQRSNQFNLTTRRRTAAEVLALLNDESWVTRTVSLVDRFGDNGLVSVLLARVTGQVLEIDTWLMSCRVLKRGVEQLLMNHLHRLALARGIRVIRGDYIPTSKNTLVRNHYADLGFTCVQTGALGQTSWESKIAADWTPLTTFIKETPTDGFAEG
jgi:FkbH-like protein